MFSPVGHGQGGARKTVSPVSHTMAPKAKQEEARAKIEEELVREAEADDVETRRLVIESKLLAQAEAADKAIHDEIARREAAEAARRERERLRRIAMMDAARKRIEADLTRQAQDEDAEENARRAALLAAQEAADISALAPTLCDASYEHARVKLSSEWDRLGQLYTHWGSSTVTPGQLLAGYRMVKSSAVEAEETALLRTYLSQLSNGRLADARADAVTHSPAVAALRTGFGEGMMRHVDTAANQAGTEAEMRLLAKCHEKGGYSERLSNGQGAILNTLAEAISRRPSNHRLAPPAPVKRPYAVPARTRPPTLGQAAPAYRQAPASTHAARRRQASHAIRASHFNPRFSHWAGTVPPSTTVHVAGLGELQPQPSGSIPSTPRTLAEVKALHDPRRPQSAQYGRPVPIISPSALPSVGGEQRALPRPSSAPPVHKGISPQMQSEMRSIVVTNM